MALRVRFLCAFVSLGVFATVAGCAIRGSAENWTALLDGGNGLENFQRVGDASWQVDDGVVQSQSGTNLAYLVSKSRYKDFLLRVKFWASDDANSGIFLRCQDPVKITADNCYEANIFDQRPDPSYGTGAIVNVAKVGPPMPKVGGQWNTYEISAKGSKIVLVLNGVKTVEVEDGRLVSGAIALQWGSGTIKFRKVEIRPL